MAFFRTVSFSDPLPIVEGEGVYLRAPQMSDFAEWAALREASRAFLTPWEPTWLHNDLVGGLTLANVRRGVAQAGSLGYWMGEPHARRGFMTAAVNALIPFAFGGLRLHRLEAACIPSNVA